MSLAAPSLPLDSRQIAMLAEMGVRIWSQPPKPDARDELAPESTQIRSSHTPIEGMPLAPRHPATRPGLPPTATPEQRKVGPDTQPQARALTQTQQPAAPAPARVADAVQPQAQPSNASAQDVSNLDWPALQALLAERTLPAGAVRVLSGHGDAHASWLFINDAPNAAAVQPPKAMKRVPPAELLLDNMLHACGISRESGAFMAYTHHVQEDGDRLTRQWLEAIIRNLRPKVVVLMSRQATQSLLQTQEAPGKLRGKPLQVGGAPVVVSYPPLLLLGKPEGKARAWADLCRAIDLAAHG